MKNFNLTVIALLLLVNSVLQAQTKEQPSLVFKTLHNLPYIIEWPATVCDGTNIYSINGYIGLGPGFSGDVLKYDPETDNWSTLTKKAGFKTQVAAALVPEKQTAYIFGGLEFGGRRIFQSVQSLNLTTGDVINLNVYNPIAAIGAWAAEWKGQVYLFGGTQGSRHTISYLFRFDPATLKFTKLADMPESLQTAGAIVDGVLYTFGGYDEFLEHQSQSINAYNIKTNKWKKMGKLPQAVSANVVAVARHLIFVIGSYDDETFLGYYNTTTNTFTQLKSNMDHRRAAGAAVVDNKLYVFGGKTVPNRPIGGVQSVQVADITDILTKEKP